MRNTYTLEFSCCEIKFEIRVNDIYFYSESGAAIDSRMTINHLVKKGVNIFSARISPSNQPLTNVSTCRLTVLNTDTDAILGEVKFRYDPQNPLDHYHLVGRFELLDEDISLAPWLQTKNAELDNRNNPDNKNVRTLTMQEIKKLYAKQHAIFELFKAKNLDAIMQEFKIKNNHYIDRFKLNPNTRLEEVRAFYSKMMNDPIWLLDEIGQQHWVPKIYARGKVFTIETFDHFAPLFYENTEEEGCCLINIYYYLNDDNEFICCL